VAPYVRQRQEWLELGRHVISRGVPARRLIGADGAAGLPSAVEEIWPRADRQHCAVHRLRNLLAKLPESEHDRIRFNYWAALTDGERTHSKNGSTGPAPTSQAESHNRYCDHGRADGPPRRSAAAPHRRTLAEWLFVVKLDSPPRQGPATRPPADRVRLQAAR
jgi:hypothetical protein